ncbi:putative phage related protein; putative exported protein [Cupriavidus taiwanensis]|uniref:hypothetical protein n=1 Tax=Cupriavidus taiwanensis TaxID=164546 RepID=UPI000E15E13F|nr:hypothetical protein [Cupriavidus taiwanensis]SPA24038.1 putative phage related protein; putative exported protein [Cupriavidus taiwanensis]
MNRTLALFLAVGVLLLGVAGTGAWMTDRYQAAQKRAGDAEAMTASLRSQLDSTEAGVIKVTEYVDRVHTVYVKGDTIIKEIARYVPAQADATCTIPIGFVRVHDAAAAGTMLGPGARDTDAASSGIALSTVAGAIAGNYTVCHANAEQLNALQQLLRDQGASIIGEAPAP